MARSDRSGFALLEVVVASAITGLASLACLAALAGQLRTASAAAQGIRAAALAEYLYAEAALNPAPRGPARVDSLTGFAPPFSGYSAVRVRAPGVPSSGLSTIEVRVRWENGEQRLDGLVRVPPESGP